MSQSRLEWKVGLFVVGCLVLIAGLALNFSKGLTFHRPTYDLQLITANVGGIKRGAAVLVAGVQVGNVVDTRLNSDGKSVTVFLKIFREYGIHKDAIFTIESQGFLGDQFVSVAPTDNKAPLLQDGGVVIGREPFNLQEAARAAAGLVAHLDKTVEQIDIAVTRVGKTVLSEETLTNLSATVANLRKLSEQVLALPSQASNVVGQIQAVSDKALLTVDHLDHLILTNTPVVNNSLSNFVLFSVEFAKATNELHGIIISNREDIATIVKNIETATIQATNILNGLRPDQGLVGSLLKDPQLQRHFSEAVSNLSVVSSNMARFGLLYKPKPVKTGH